MNKVLVTGSEGFIGKYIMKAVKGYGYDILNGDDIRDRYKLDVLMNNEKFDTVVNLAARAGVKYGELYPEEYFSTNVLGLENLVFLCEKHEARLIHFSSSSVFKSQDRPLKEEDEKEPISFYGITKLTGELLVKKSKCDWTIIRPFTVLGGLGRKGMIIDRWITQIKNHQPVTFYGDGTTSRGYTYVEDLVQGVLDCKVGDFNIGGDQAVTLNEMWQMFQEVFPEAQRKILPLPVYDIPNSIADTTKAFLKFGWQPKTNIKEKIKEWLEEIKINL